MYIHTYKFTGKCRISNKSDSEGKTDHQREGRVIIVHPFSRARLSTLDMFFVPFTSFFFAVGNENKF